MPWFRLPSSSVRRLISNQSPISLASMCGGSGLRFGSQLTCRVVQRPDVKLTRPFSLSPLAFKATPKKDVFSKAFTWRSFAVLVIFGSGYIYLYQSVKRDKEEKAAGEREKVIGQAALGGDWTLSRLDGSTGGSRDLRGEFALIYFGFTNCPDICPEEIEKAVKVVDVIEDRRKNHQIFKRLVPVFITIDPARDSADVVKNYVAEFSAKIVGFVGTDDEIKTASRNFRVYYSKGPVDEDGDYIVDHSIIMYLIGPDGMFLDYYGQNQKADDMIASIGLKMAQWDAKVKRGEFVPLAT